MQLNKVKYDELNDKQKENYNYSKVSSALAEYGYNCIKLADDYKGADFIAMHINGKDSIMIQLKGRWTIAKKYIGKNLYVAYPEHNNESIWLFNHDDMVQNCSEHVNYLSSKSWDVEGAYSSASHPKKLESLMMCL